MNQNKFTKLFRFSMTFLVVMAAVFAGLRLWNNYMNSPWTRDGRIRADITLVAPDVDGLISSVLVRDNQFVRKGDVLFQIDERRFLDAYHESKALVEAKKVEYQMKKHQSARRKAINDESISKEDKEDSDYEATISKAKYEQSLEALKTASLNLERTKVRAPTDGWVSNLLLRQGDYAKVGASYMALVNKDSFWVNGYFEEHKISMMHIGDKAEIRPLGTNFVIKGHVDSIAKAIIDRDNTTGERLLANVNPIFTWVRLAQRVPVRITIDEVPKDMTLSAGMTCSVKALTK